MERNNSFIASNVEKLQINTVDSSNSFVKTYDPSRDVPATGTPEKTESDTKVKDPSEEETHKGNKESSEQKT